MPPSHEWRLDKTVSFPAYSLFEAVTKGLQRIRISFLQQKLRVEPELTGSMVRMLFINNPVFAEYYTTTHADVDYRGNINPDDRVKAEVAIEQFFRDRCTPIWSDGIGSSPLTFWSKFESNDAFKKTQVILANENYKRPLHNYDFKATATEDLNQPGLNLFVPRFKGASEALKNNQFLLNPQVFEVIEGKAVINCQALVDTPITKYDFVEKDLAHIFKTLLICVFAGIALAPQTQEFFDALTNDENRIQSVFKIFNDKYYSHARNNDPKLYEIFSTALTRVAFARKGKPTPTSTILKEMLAAHSVQEFVAESYIFKAPIYSSQSSISIISTAPKANSVVTPLFTGRASSVDSSKPALKLIETPATSSSRPLSHAENRKSRKKMPETSSSHPTVEEEKKTPPIVKEKPHVKIAAKEKSVPQIVQAMTDASQIPEKVKPSKVVSPTIHILPWFQEVIADAKVKLESLKAELQAFEKTYNEFPKTIQDSLSKQWTKLQNIANEAQTDLITMERWNNNNPALFQKKTDDANQKKFLFNQKLLNVRNLIPAMTKSMNDAQLACVAHEQFQAFLHQAHVDIALVSGIAKSFFKDDQKLFAIVARANQLQAHLTNIAAHPPDTIAGMREQINAIKKAFAEFKSFTLPKQKPETQSVGVPFRFSKPLGLLCLSLYLISLILNKKNDDPYIAFPIAGAASIIFALLFAFKPDFTKVLNDQIIRACMVGPGTIALYLGANDLPEMAKHIEQMRGNGNNALGEILNIFAYSFLFSGVIISTVYGLIGNSFFDQLFQVLDKFLPDFEKSINKVAPLPPNRGPSFAR